MMETPVSTTPPAAADESIRYITTESLDTLVVLNIIQTANKLSPFLNRDLKELALTSVQLNVLLLLKETEGQGLTLSEIGRRLLVSKPNITGLIDRIERKGFIERNTTDDRRVTIVKLTGQGMDLLEHIAPQHQKMLAELTRGLDEEKKRNLIQLMVELRRGMREILCNQQQAPEQKKNI
jgi:MarR family transcriptional regulator, 2-MHQ and catechol-resistance regulon repressor